MYHQIAADTGEIHRYKNDKNDRQVYGAYD